GLPGMQGRFAPCITKRIVEACRLRSASASLEMAKFSACSDRLCASAIAAFAIYNQWNRLDQQDLFKFFPEPD
ncbi:MAG: hypothetical protein D3923_13215, partial [Candidatus Electrothrix sp. AR3]|nr:hypothetical protein [Candidatus Electrothrix sp. AR3]